MTLFDKSKAPLHETELLVASDTIFEIQDIAIRMQSDEGTEFPLRDYLSSAMDELLEEIDRRRTIILDKETKP